MAKIIPIRFNDKVLGQINELSNLMGISNSYGSVSKALRFSLAVTLAALKYPNKLYIGLNEAEHDYYLLSMARFEKKQKLEEIAQNFQKKANNV